MKTYMECFGYNNEEISSKKFEEGFKSLSEAEDNTFDYTYDTNGNDYNDIEWTDEKELDKKEKETEIQKQRDEEIKQESEKGKEILDKILSNGGTFENFFDELVPPTGTCETLAGEIVRAMNKVDYRCYNDGDYFFCGYGLETCGPAMMFVYENVSDAQIDIDDMLYNPEEYYEDGGFSSKEYETKLETIKNIIVKYIKDNPRLLVTKNTKDMLDTSTRYIENEIKNCELECNMSNDVTEYMDTYENKFGDSLADDLVNYLYGCLDSIWCETDGIEISIPYGWGGTVFFSNVPIDSYNTIEKHFDKWLDDIYDEWIDEYGNLDDEEDYDED